MLVSWSWPLSRARLAQTSLQATIWANTDSRTAGDVFSQQNTRGGSFGASVVICPLLDDRGHRQGAFCQSLDDPSSQRSLDNELLGQNSDAEYPGDMQQTRNNEFLDKSEADQDEILSKALPPRPADRDSSDAVARHGHIDLKQSQLFQRFAELLPTGLAILNYNVSARFLRVPCAPGCCDTLSRQRHVLTRAPRPRLSSSTTNSSA